MAPQRNLGAVHLANVLDDALEALRLTLGLVFAVHLGQHRKPVAANARDHVVRTAGSSQGLPHHLEDAVAERVPVHLVEVAHAADVGDRTREVLTVPIKDPLAHGRRRRQTARIENTRKLIGLGQPVESVEHVTAPAVGHRPIGEEPEQADGLAVAPDGDLVCRDVANLALRDAGSLRVDDRNPVVDDTQLVVHERVLVHVPAHVLVGLAQHFIDRIEGVEVEEVLVHAHEPTVFVLPEHAGGHQLQQRVPQKRFGHVVLVAHARHDRLVGLPRAYEHRVRAVDDDGHEDDGDPHVQAVASQSAKRVSQMRPFAQHHALGHT